MNKLTCMTVGAVSALLFSAGGSAAIAASSPPPYSTVSQKNLENPSPNDWLMYRRRYRSWGYSPLKQINADNVKDLKLAWSYTTGGDTGGYESVPIVNGKYMFVTTPNDTLIALNAATGERIWEYKYQLPQQLKKLHPTNRGVAVYGDSVYMATLDCKLVAVNAKTGKKEWVANNGNWKHFQYSTLAPLAINGMILTGCSGGETGVRGSITAYNAKTGKREWRFWTVPKRGEPGGDSWPKGAYKHGGGPIWITGSYDPKTNITYWGTGNPGPWVAGMRKGKNLYTNTIVALDASTGKLKAYFQPTPHGAWDWDGITTPLLITTERNGKKVQVVTQANRNGYLYMLNREPGKLLDFMHAWPFANNNVITKINPKTGEPSYDESKAPGLDHGADFCPSAWGGKDWWATAYNPNTKLLYIPANVTMCGHMPKGHVIKYEAGDTYIGFPLSSIMSSIRLPGNPDHIGQMQAWDLSTGKKVWKHNFHGLLWSPVLTTAGNLLFGGGTSDRLFHAYDATTGKVLWTAPAPSGIIAPPVAYKIDGTEYIAVQAGWGVDAQRVLGQVNEQRGTNVFVPKGGTMLVYKLEDK